MKAATRALKHFLVSGADHGFYFDLAEIEQNARLLQSLIQPRLQILFPVKSFPAPEVLALMGQLCQGFDVSNATELELCRPYLNPQHLVWSSGPFPWSAQGEHSIFMDGPHADSGWQPNDRRALRVRLPQTGTFLSRFGYPVTELTPAWLKTHAIAAIHFHHGVEPMPLDLIQSAYQTLAHVINPAPGVTHVNLGGGFASLTFGQIEALLQLALRIFPDKTVLFEPGRWVCGDAGVLLGRVMEVTEEASRLVVTTNLSRDCHLRWMRDKFSVSFHSMEEHPARRHRQLSVGGPTCSESDRIADLQAAEPMSVAKGDVVAVGGVSGYSFAWNHSFNGVPRAPVYFLPRKNHE